MQGRYVLRLLLALLTIASLPLDVSGQDEPQPAALRDKFPPIPEPMGGAHRDVDEMAARIKSHIVSQLEALEELPLEDLLAKRYQRLMSYGN